MGIRGKSFKAPSKEFGMDFEDMSDSQKEAYANAQAVQDEYEKSDFDSLSEDDKSRFADAVSVTDGLDRKQTMPEVVGREFEKGRKTLKNAPQTLEEDGGALRDFTTKYGILPRTEGEEAEHAQSQKSFDEMLGGLPDNIPQGFYASDYRPKSPRKEVEGVADSVMRTGLNTANTLTYNQLQRWGPVKEILGKSRPNELFWGTMIGYGIQGGIINKIANAVPKKFVLHYAKEYKKAEKLLKRKGMWTGVTPGRMGKAVQHVRNRHAWYMRKAATGGEALEGGVGEWARRTAEDDENYAFRGDNKYVADEILLQGGVPAAFDFLRGLIKGGKKNVVKWMGGYKNPAMKTMVRGSESEFVHRAFSSLVDFEDSQQLGELVSITKRDLTEKSRSYNKQLSKYENKINAGIKQDYPNKTWPIGGKLFEKLDGFKQKFTQKNQWLIDEIDDLTTKERRIKARLKQLEDPSSTYVGKQYHRENPDVLSKKVDKYKKDLALTETSLETAKKENESVWKLGDMKVVKKKYDDAVETLRRTFGQKNKALNFDEMLELKAELNSLGEILAADKKVSSDPTIMAEFNKVSGYLKDVLYGDIPEAGELYARLTRKQRVFRPLIRKLFDVEQDDEWIKALGDAGSPEAKIVRELTDPDMWKKTEDLYAKTKKFAPMNEVGGANMSRFQKDADDFIHWTGEGGLPIEVFNAVTKEGQSGGMISRGASGAREVIMGGLAMTGGLIGSNTEQSNAMRTLSYLIASVGGVGMVGGIIGKVKSPAFLAKLADPDFLYKIGGRISRLKGMVGKPLRIAITKLITEAQRQAAKEAGEKDYSNLSMNEATKKVFKGRKKLLSEGEAGIVEMTEKVNPHKRRKK